MKATEDDGKVHDAPTDAAVAAPEAKLDRHGLPLVPQPSDRKDDPLVCWEGEGIRSTN